MCPLLPLSIVANPANAKRIVEKQAGEFEFQHA
jgi:hypothetical protein